METDFPSRQENLSRWLSVDEIAIHLGVSKVSVYKWSEAGRIPAHKVGRQWKFCTSEVDSWVRSGRAKDETIPLKGSKE